LTQNGPPGVSAACSRLLRLAQISSAGGSIDTEVTAVMVMPTGSLPAREVTMQTVEVSRRMA
jgi:hypothetical protein